jgi:ketosteroid isomerase-like protein
MPPRPASPFVFLLALLRTAALAQGAPAAAPPAADPPAVIERFIAAFNRHDLTLMSAETDADVRWLSVADDRVLPDARGQAALQEWMARFFSVYPTASRTIEQSIAHGPFVSAWERARWKDKRGEERTQDGLVVYEIREGKIRNVWRYAPQP